MSALISETAEDQEKQMDNTQKENDEHQKEEEMKEEVKGEEIKEEKKKEEPKEEEKKRDETKEEKNEEPKENEEQKRDQIKEEKKEEPNEEEEKKRDENRGEKEAKPKEEEDNKREEMREIKKEEAKEVEIKEAQSEEKRRRVKRNGEANTGILVTNMLIMSVGGCVCGTGLVFGYNTGVVNNPQVVIQQSFNKIQKERTGEEFSPESLHFLWSSCVGFWALVGPLGVYLSTTLAQKVGRRDTMLLLNVLLVVAALLQSCSKLFKSYEMFLIGRIFMGIENAACTAVGPIYLCEIAPKRIRGSIGAVFQVSVVTGILIAQILSFRVFLGDESDWPFLFNVNLLFAFSQCSILYFCPRSPAFLLITKRNREASREALVKLRGESEIVDEELEDLLDEERKEKIQPQITYKKLIGLNYLRRPLIIGCVMAMSQQLSGINAIIYYSEPIFEGSLSATLVRENPDFPRYLVSLTGVVNLIVCTTSMYTVERLGRRFSHLVGLGGMAVCSAVIGVLLSGVEIGNQSCQGIDSGRAGNSIALYLIFISVAFFSLGPGPIPWLITSEMFTTSARPLAITIVVSTNWVCNFFVALAFDPLRHAMCGWVFMIFFVLLAIFLTNLHFQLPEVTGKTTTEIVAMFEDHDFPIVRDCTAGC